MFRSHMFVAQPFSFFRCKIQDPLALLAQRHFHRCGNALADRDARFDFFTDGFNRAVRTQKAVRERLVLTQQAQQQVVSLYVRTAVLARLVPCEKDHAPSFFRIAFKHVSPALSLSLCCSACLPRYRSRGTCKHLTTRLQLAVLES